MNLNHQQYQQRFLANVNGHVPNGAELYGVRVQPVAAGAGDEIWRVIGVHHLSPAENQGNHHVYVDVMDADGQRINDPSVRVQWGWEDQSPEQKTNPAALDKGAGEPATNVPIFDGQRIWVTVDGRGLPSDRVENLHTDHADELTADGQKWNSKGHHSYYIAFQRQRSRVQAAPVNNPPVEPVHVDPLPGGQPAGVNGTPPQPVPLRQGSVRLRHKLGIDGNAPVDTGSGAIAGRLSHPNLLRELGVGWVRLNFILSPWADLHIGPLHQGRTWAQTYRQIIDNLKAQGVHIFGLISDEALDGPHDRFRQPPAGDPLNDAWIQEYAKRFVAIARLFKDDLDVLEMFNEPDDWKQHEVPGFTEQSKNYVHPAWFAAMMEAVYRAMRSPQNADLHHIPLVSGPLQGLDINGNAGVEYLSRTYDAGEARFGWGTSRPYPFDGVGYHLYIAQNPGDPDADIRKMYNDYMGELRALVQRREGALKPIYISEIGWPTIDNEDKQAACLQVGMPLVLHDPSVALAFWFCIEDFEKKFGLFGQGMQHRKRPLEPFKQLAASNVDVPVPVVTAGAAAAAAAIQVTPPPVPQPQPHAAHASQLPTPGAGEWLGYVNTTVLNVRSSPDVDERNKIGELVLDRRVVVRFVAGEWFFVHAGNVQGFVRGDFITPVPASAGTRSLRPAPTTDVVSRLPLLDTPPLTGRDGKTLAESDPELYQAWSRHIQQGFENNQRMFDQVLKGFMSPYWTTVWMYRALFAVGILSFIAAIVLAIMGTSQTAETGVPVAVFGGLSVVAFLSYFLSKPLQALEENLQLITWLGIVYNSYWVRLVYTTKVDTVQAEIDATTNATIDKLKDLIETHKELSGNRPGLR